MKLVFITPCQNDLLVEIPRKASEELSALIKKVPWLIWKEMQDVNGRGKRQWYIVVDTSVNKEKRLKYFARFICEKEGYEPSSRIHPHDLYYEDFEKYFSCYK